MDYKQEILSLLKEVQREGISNLIEFLESSDYFTAPASTIFHGNYDGALCEHCYKVFKCLEKKNETYKLNIPRYSIIITALCHDLCKIDFYKKDKRNVKENGKWIEKEVYVRDEKLPLGHGSKSIIMLRDFIELTEWEMYAIMWHMGIPEDYEGKQGFNKAKELMPSCLALYFADFESSVFLEKTLK